MEHKILDYNKITDTIFIGTNQCCRVHFDEMLKKEGITGDISLEENQLDQPFGVETYSWLPVIDQTPPSDSQIAYGTSILSELERQNKKVYVHCKNGHGRAPTLVAAYFITKKGINAQEAIDTIKKQRPSVHFSASQIESLKHLKK
jgi:protein-tyrosine phosphatase